MADLQALKPCDAPTDRTEAEEASSRLERLLSACFPREMANAATYAKRRFVFQQGDRIDAVYYVLAGLIGLERVDEDGRMSILTVLRPGSLIGWPEALGSAPHRNGAEALALSRVAVLPRQGFLAAIDRDPDLAAALTQQMAIQLGAYEEHILRLSTLDVPERLYSTLCSLADATPATDGTLEFSVPLLKRDLAALIGTSPEGVSRSLRRLEEMEVVEWRGRHTIRIRGAASDGAGEAPMVARRR